MADAARRARQDGESLGDVHLRRRRPPGRGGHLRARAGVEHRPDRQDQGLGGEHDPHARQLEGPHQRHLRAAGDWPTD
eukprot:7284155-Pyramimonas_sp.AAC.1